VFPLAFLLFMVPPPEEWHRPLVVWLQTWASTASVSALYTLGVPVYLEGYVIQMAGGLQVEVAEACSGATSLYTLTALGVLLAFLSLSRWTTRCALVALVLPAALVGNLVRVVVTVLLCLEIGLERATSGWVHTALGLLIYVVAVGLLLAADAALRRLERPAAA
jgi:exosortase